MEEFDRKEDRLADIREKFNPTTYWNGEHTPCKQVRVVVGKSPYDTWWCADLEGTERKAVEVRYGKDVFYLDNEDGTGWTKVTEGLGAPNRYHRSLPVERVL